MKKQRQIIAMGGGGFSMEPENHLLDDYILKASRKVKPKICFLATASGDARGYIDNFYTFFKTKTCVPSHLSLFNGHTDKIEKFILSQDILYIGGGNTRNMLVLWKEWKLDKAIVKAYKKGTLLCGLSAGSICWFEQGLTDSVPNQLNKLDCLGILKGSNCPHFDGEEKRRPAYKKLIQSGQMKGGIATDDGCALHYIDEKLFNIISSRQTAKAYSFIKKLKKTEEKVLSPNFLGRLK
jgi:peptidase E